MLKNIILILILSSSSFVLSQNGSVLYKINNVSILSDELKEKYNDEVIKMFEEANNKKKELEFELIFNNEESLFKLKDKAIYSDPSFGMAKINSNANSIYYFNIRQKKRIEQIDFEGTIINITKDECDWVITKETKKISKYIVNKAICKIEYFDKMKDKQVKKEKIAWFTYDIPASFDPGGLDGLPGLILEGSLNNKETFYASSIDLNNRVKNEIKLPSADRFMTQLEFNEMMQSKVARFKRK
jgi:GLPGLI family protein